VTTRERVRAVPDIPTIAESGLPGFDVFSWFAFWVPVRTPPDVVGRINADTNAALAHASVKPRFEELVRTRKARPRPSSPPSTNGARSFRRRSSGSKTDRGTGRAKGMSTVPRQPSKSGRYLQPVTTKSRIGVISRRAYLNRMVETRIALRHRVVKAGTTEFGSSSINCMVRNLSTTRSRARGVQPDRHPCEIHIVRQDGSYLPCNVVRRSGYRIDVAFTWRQRRIIASFLDGNGDLV
jgi:hypothetical protein